MCYRDHSSFPENKNKLGRIIGPCKNESNDMSPSIVSSSSNAITRQTARYLRMSELHSETEKRKRRAFDVVILQKIGDPVEKPTKLDTSDHVPYSDDVDSDSVQLPDDDDPVIPDSATVFEKPITDQWNHVTLNLPQGELLQKVKFFSRTKDGNSDIKGSHESKSFLRTFTCDVKFPHDEIKG